jgi:hypothetical protein
MTTTSEPAEDRPEKDRQGVLTVLTTEHFALQGARGSTVSESSARAALYVGGVSSSLVALGFFGQGAERGAFNAFTLVVLPTVYLLGVFTFARLVESSTEDLLYGRAINRIRQYYLEILGEQSRYVVLGAHDDVLGVLANMGIARPSRWQLSFTLAMMIAMLNAVVGGSAAGFLLSVVGVPLGLALGLGAVTALVSIVIHVRWQRHAHVEAREDREVLLPSD